MGLAKPNDRGDRGAGRTHAKETGGDLKAGAGKATVNGSLRFEFASGFEAGLDVQRQILAEIERRGFNTNSVFATRLALEEALVNAIKHGNQLDPKKKVVVEAKVTPQRVEIVIDDEGPGFDRLCVPDPTADENLCKCSGRGVMLIEAYMNSVKWSHGGRRIRMVRYNDPNELPERA